MKKIRYIDLFAGCGGLSLGLDLSENFECAGFIEIWEPAIETFKTNLYRVNTNYTQLNKLR